MFGLEQIWAETPAMMIAGVLQIVVMTYFEVCHMRAIYREKDVRSHSFWYYLMPTIIAYIWFVSLVMELENLIVSVAVGVGCLTGTIITGLVAYYRWFYKKK